MPGILMLFGIAFIYLAATRKFSALLGVVNATAGTAANTSTTGTTPQ